MQQIWAVTRSFYGETGNLSFAVCLNSNCFGRIFFFYHSENRLGKICFGRIGVQQE